VVSADSNAYKRYIYLNGQLEKVPQSLSEAWSSPLTAGVFGAAAREMFKPKSTSTDESVFAFIERRFGRHVAENLVDPMVAGIYSGDPKKLSVKSCFRLLHDLEREHGSVVKGMLKGMLGRKKKAKVSPLYAKLQKAGGIYSFQGGMSTLTNALAAQIPHTEALTSTYLFSISFSLAQSQYLFTLMLPIHARTHIYILTHLHTHTHTHTYTHTHTHTHTHTLY
jgi:oxygen-dependent protoporphyrinogen oxidase